MFCHRQSGGTTFRGDQLKYDRSLTSDADVNGALLATSVCWSNGVIIFHIPHFTAAG